MPLKEKKVPLWMNKKGGGGTGHSASESPFKMLSLSLYAISAFKVEQKYFEMYIVTEVKIIQ